MNRRSLFVFWSLGLGLLASSCGLPSRSLPLPDGPWTGYKGGDGPGSGKQVVLISGDDEYRSEETLPQLAKILSVRHGFTCTVLFAIDPQDGSIKPDHQQNIPGLEALESADLMIIFTRFRDLPNEQLKHIVDYVESGRPIVGLRTSTHAFHLRSSDTYKHYTWNFTEGKWAGGFGRRILGETWINHHGAHGSQSTRGIIAEVQSAHPIVRGVEGIWGPTDVYGVRLPLPAGCEPLVFGQVLSGMSPSDRPLEGEKNAPMMPIAWMNRYTSDSGKAGRAFTTTMGASQSFANEGLRRLLVNASYWAVGMEEKIPARSDVGLVGDYNPTAFGFGTYTSGVRPEDHRLAAGKK